MLKATWCTAGQHDAVIERKCLLMVAFEIGRDLGERTVARSGMADAATVDLCECDQISVLAHAASRTRARGRNKTQRSTAAARGAITLTAAVYTFLSS